MLPSVAGFVLRPDPVVRRFRPLPFCLVARGVDAELRISLDFQAAKRAINRASILEKKSFESRRRNPNAETLQFGISQELMGGTRFRTFHDPIR